MPDIAGKARLNFHAGNQHSEVYVRLNNLDISAFSGGKLRLFFVY